MTVEQWEERTEWWLAVAAVAAVAFLAAYAWPILDPGLVEPCRWTNAGVWALFIVDYLVRLRLAERRLRFVRHHLVDLAVIVLPLLRPLRLLRLLTVLNVLNRYAGSSFRGRVALYVSGATGLTLFVASLAMLEAERGRAGSTIANFGDAVWWAATTVTTVGYGDIYPVTGTGRVISAALMLAGIALLGIVTASLASWLLDRVREVEAESQAATRRDVALLAAEVSALRRRLEAADGL